MHPIAFQLKRIHLSAVASQRRVFRDGALDMTPARFEILYVIGGGQDARTLRTQGGGLEMAEVTRQLGLSRATVSVAIDRLVELGLVRRDGSGGRRGKRVSLTKEGLTRIRRAVDLVAQRGRLVDQRRLH